MKPRILVVEDEPSILDNLLYSLSTEGFEVHGEPTGEKGLAVLDQETIDLIILDIGLPDTSGFELCKTIRKTSNVPIIFLTARSDEIDKIVGLEIGADDYLVKPFSPRELCARVKAVLRRTRAGKTSEDEASGSEPAAGTAKATEGLPFRVDERRASIHYFDQPLTLSSTEYRLLKTFCHHPGRVYSRAQLMEVAWAEPDAAMERTVDAHVKSLRAKLRDIHGGVDPIETHRGLGYALRENW
ncbi:MAG: two-component system response regulator CreB [Verrucomicrobiota bacterium]